jgi:hypothetical protein
MASSAGRSAGFETAAPVAKVDLESSLGPVSLFMRESR